MPLHSCVPGGNQGPTKVHFGKIPYWWKCPQIFCICRSWSDIPVSLPSPHSHLPPYIQKALQNLLEMPLCWCIPGSDPLSALLG